MPTFLQVITIADIATRDGTKIEEKYNNCQPKRRSCLTWPNQIEPKGKQQKLWKKMMERLSLKRKLVTTLGHWKLPPHQIWDHMVEMPEGRLLIYNNGTQYAHY